MGLFNLFSKKSAGPYKNEGFNTIYNLLFCDNIDLFKSETKNPIYPWDILLAPTADTDKLNQLAKDKTLESRQRLLAYNLLRKNGFKTDEKELLGIIVEVALPLGLDVLAAFSDGTGRYFNQSEKLMIWEKQTEHSTDLFQKLFSAGTNVINQIGPWDKPRRPFPKDQMARITFLVSDGLYFGEGPLNILMTDPISGEVLHSATNLLAYFTELSVVNQQTT